MPLRYLSVAAFGCCVASGVRLTPTGDVCVRSENVQYCSFDGSLKVKSTSKTTGSDSLGPYTKDTTLWMPVDFETSTFSYSDQDTVIYRQRFPTGLNGTMVTTNPQTSMDLISSQFPSFIVKEGPYKGFLQYKGQMMGMRYAIGSTADDIREPLVGGAQDSSPLVLFNQNESVVLSAASNFMSHSQNVVGENADTVAYGLMGSITNVPAGYELDTIVSYSKTSIKASMDKWGAKLLTIYGKDRKTADQDITTNHLGYSTDNGAWYYYNTEPGKNYQQTMKDVKAYSLEAKLPYQHWLMDSWWYFKGDGNAVKNWTAMPSIFPDGIANVTADTHWPIVAHNRYWAGNTDYAKQNGGQYNFIVEGPHSIPDDQVFWDDLIHNATSWGLYTYEQDWLHNEFVFLNATLQSPTLARRWLLQMGSAASKYNINIQYCMSWSRHMLQSVEIQSVTQARASDDYHPGGRDGLEDWHPLGVTGMFAHAIAIKPTKDNFWTTDKEVGRYGTDIERFNRLHAIVSTLSTGPVAPSDQNGMTDVDLVMRSCNAVGRILSPDVPATLMDSVFMTMSGQTPNGPTGDIWSTYSIISNIKNHYLLAANASAHIMSKSELCPEVPAETSLVAWESNSTSTVQPFSDSEPINLPATGKWDFQFWTVAPVLSNGWVVMGEASTKWVPLSASRFVSVVTSGSSLTVTLLGKPGEEVTLFFLKPSSLEPTKVTCTFKVDALTLTMPEGSC